MLPRAGGAEGQGRTFAPKQPQKGFTLFSTNPAVVETMSISIYEGASCICCGILREQALYLWEVTPAFWCTQCYLGQFPMGAASGIFYEGSIPYFPPLNIVECMKVEREAVVIESSVGRVVPQVTTYTNGTYCPVYVKLWKYPNGDRVSTTHLIDGRFIVIGPRLPPELHQTPEQVSRAKEEPDVGEQTETAGIVPNPMGVWGYDEEGGQLVEVIPEGLVGYRNSEESAPYSPDMTQGSASPNTILDQNVLTIAKAPEDQLKEMEADEGLLGLEPPGLDKLVIDSPEEGDDPSSPEDDVLIITAPEDDNSLDGEE